MSKSLLRLFELSFSYCFGFLCIVLFIHLLLKLNLIFLGVPLDLLVCSISGGGFIIVSDNFTPILINLDCLNYGDKRCQLQIKEAPMTQVQQNAEIFQTDFGYHHRCQPYMLPLLQDPVWQAVQCPADAGVFRHRPTTDCSLAKPASVSLLENCIEKLYLTFSCCTPFQYWEDTFYFRLDHRILTGLLPTWQYVSPSLFIYSAFCVATSDGECVKVTALAASTEGSATSSDIGCQLWWVWAASRYNLNYWLRNASGVVKNGLVGVLCALFAQSRVFLTP